MLPLVEMELVMCRCSSARNFTRFVDAIGGEAPRVLPLQSRPHKGGRYCCPLANVLARTRVPFCPRRRGPTATRVRIRRGLLLPLQEDSSMTSPSRLRLRRY